MNQTKLKLSPVEQEWCNRLWITPPEDRPNAYARLLEIVWMAIESEIPDSKTRDIGRTAIRLAITELLIKKHQTQTDQAESSMRFITGRKAEDDPEKRALTYFRKKFWDHCNKETAVSLDSVAKTVLRCALAHPKELESWISATAEYRIAEGFDSHEQVELSFIDGRKEYRRVKV